MNNFISIASIPSTKLINSTHEDKIAQIYHVSEFLFVHQAFFTAAIFDLDFRNWAKAHEKDMQEIVVATEKFLDSKKVDAPIALLPYGLFISALIGPAFADEKNLTQGLFAGNLNPIVFLLHESPKLLEALIQFIKKPVVELWFTEHSQHEAKREENKKIAVDGIFLQKCLQTKAALLVAMQEKVKGSLIDSLLGNKDKTAELVVAARDQNEAEVKTLLSKKVNPDQQNAQLETALMVAASNGNVFIMNFLLQAGASLRVINSKGNNTLHIATLSKRKEAMSLLLENKADPNQPDSVGNTALMLAVSMQFILGINLLMPRSDLNIKNRFGYTVIALAMKFGFNNLLSTLIDRAIETQTLNLTEVVTYKKNNVVANRLDDCLFHYATFIAAQNTTLATKIADLLNIDVDDIFVDAATESGEDIKETPEKDIKLRDTENKKSCQNQRSSTEKQRIQASNRVVTGKTVCQAKLFHPNELKFKLNPISKTISKVSSSEVSLKHTSSLLSTNLLNTKRKRVTKQKEGSNKSLKTDGRNVAELNISF